MTLTGERAVPAHAKVNLWLHVTGRLANGYHSLDSLHVRTSLADRLWFTPAASTALEVTGRFSAALRDLDGSRNLVTRAIAAVAPAQAFRIVLEKNIPVASGLGGGSADAAATLRTVSGLSDDLPAIAATLGADVPSCLHDGAVMTAGTGDVVTPVEPFPPCALVLVNPGTGLSTATVFAGFDEPLSVPRPLTRPPESFDDLVGELENRRNDLEPAACRVDPGICDVLAALRTTPGIALARMTGTGATCFGLAGTLQLADRAATLLRRHHPGWWIETTTILAQSRERT